MSSSISAAGGRLLLSGAVDHDNAEQLRDEGLRLIREEFSGAANVTVDLSQVEEANSVLLAVLLSWFRALSKAETEMTLDSVPANLQSILSFTGVDEVLA